MIVIDSAPVLDALTAVVAGTSVSFSYYRASADDVRGYLIRRERDPKTGAVVSIDVCPFLARYVCDWSGFGDCTSTPIPWPGAGALPPGAPLADGQRTVTSDEIAVRARLLAMLPGEMWDTVIDLDRAICRAHAEGEESGKG